MMPKRYFIFLFYVLLMTLGYGQSDTTIIVAYDSEPLTVREIDESDLQGYRDNHDFDYDIVKTESPWWEDFKTWLGNIFLQFFEWLFGIEKAVGYFATFLRAIPYLLLGVLIFILVKLFLKVNANALKQSQKNQSLVSLSEEEHIIKNEDIGQLIQKALRDQNFRLAIRYYYLFILQLMSEKEIIVWELQKTNDDYLNEIQNRELKDPFRKITHWYDYIWYGSFDIDETKYKKAETTFSNLQKSLENG